MSALVYRWPYTLTVEFHVKSNKVEIIMLDLTGHVTGTLSGPPASSILSWANGLKEGERRSPLMAVRKPLEISGN